VMSAARPLFHRKQKSIRNVAPAARSEHGTGCRSTDGGMH
jgi:hypothetical protein